MKISPICSPSGGVFLWTPEGTGGCSLSVSLITASKKDILERDIESISLVKVKKSSISSLSRESCAGSIASWKKSVVSAAAVVSLLLLATVLI
jgi:hypothetical protein